MATASQPLPQIVLSADQIKAIQAAERSSVVLLDDNGKRAGYAASSDCLGWTAEDIAIAKARLAAPGRHYTTEEVLARLEA
jgi:hypothetical protein